MSRPNFFIVGAPKAGTDELYYHLDQHPEIYMSPLKEPCFFSSEVRLENFHPSLRSQAQLAAESLRQYLDGSMDGKRFGGIVSDWKDYENLFSKVEDEKAIGEGSVCYLWSPSAPSAIASSIQHARIIIVLMDPAERAFRQYLKSVSDGTVGHSFRTHIQMALRDDRKSLGIYHPFLALGNYAESVCRYMRLFPAEQLHISLYEERNTDTEGWFANLLEFLDVDSSFVPAPVEVPSTPHVPRFIGISRALQLQSMVRRAKGIIPEALKPLAKQLIYPEQSLPHLDPEDRAVLVAYYRQDVIRLQDILARDLSSWLV